MFRCSVMSFTVRLSYEQSAPYLQIFGFPNFKLQAMVLLTSATILNAVANAKNRPGSEGVECGGIDNRDVK